MLTQKQRQRCTVLNCLEEYLQLYGDVDFNAHREALEDPLKINPNAAWRKADGYDSKLDATPINYVAICLYLYYSYYSENRWVKKLGWLEQANAGFQELWALYKGELSKSEYDGGNNTGRR